MHGVSGHWVRDVLLGSCLLPCQGYDYSWIRLLIFHRSYTIYHGLCSDQLMSTRECMTFSTDGESSDYAVRASPALTMLGRLIPLGETMVHRVALFNAFLWL